MRGAEHDLLLVQYVPRLTDLDQRRLAHPLQRVWPPALFVHDEVHSSKRAEADGLPNIERLHAENPQGAVVVQADKNSKNGLLVQVLDAAKAAGVQNVSLAADPGA